MSNNDNGDEQKYFVTGKKAKEILGISDTTLRRWDREKKIETIRMVGNKRLYNIKNFIQKQSENSNDDKKRTSVCYCRVSSKKQSDDLERQISKMSELYPNNKIISDIGSGINWKRPGLFKLIQEIKNNKIKDVIIFHRDRLCRFAFELLENIFKLYNTKIIILDSTEEFQSSQDELAEDLLSIIHVFNCKQMGRRRYKKK